MINILDVTPDSICGDLTPILKLVGIIIWAIKVVVPIILIVVGMIDLAKAVGEKDEGKIKEAQNRLVKRAIAAVLVFLVIYFVIFLMGLIGAEDYKECMPCVQHPFRCKSADINS